MVAGPLLTPTTCATIFSGVTMNCRIKKRILWGARYKVIRAVRCGEMQKPHACEICRQVKRRIMAHHYDYRRPLEIVWLCPKCHYFLHFNQIHHPRKALRLEDVKRRLEILKRRQELAEWGYLADSLPRPEAYDSDADRQSDDNQGFIRYTHRLEVDGTIRGRMRCFA